METGMYDQLLELVQKRRSIRQFKPDPIPEGSIEKIIDVARWAPSGFHTQPWEFVAVTDSEVKTEILAVLDSKSPPITNPDESDGAVRRSFRDAPAMIFALCDWRSYAGLPFSPEPDSPIVEKIFTSSMASVFVYMHLAA